MGLRDTTRWEIAGLSTGLALIYFNPFSFRIGRLLFSPFGDTGWYAKNTNVPTPAGMILHVAVFFFVLYFFLRLDWKCET
jgi:hypothetical protein